jgi:hypothetical protein
LGEEKGKSMNSRERFLETMRYGSPDRVFFLDEGIREEVIHQWRKQGLRRGSDLQKMFPMDAREEIELILDPQPDFKQWPSSSTHLDELRRRLNPDDAGRLPKGWRKKIRAWRKRDHLLILRVHRGFFLSMGVHGSKRFRQVIHLLIRDPEFVREAMMIQGRFAAKLAEKVLRDIEIDAALFVEPIAGDRGPLISPKMYRKLVLPSYEPILEVLGRYHVETIIFLSFANPRLLIPSIVEWGFNCLWACETNKTAMDYRDLRREFGKDLRLIGGIDLDTLRRGKDAIQQEMEEILPPLLDDGGYIPTVDGRMREDIPFENYTYYRKLLETLAGAVQI